MALWKAVVRPVRPAAARSGTPVGSGPAERERMSRLIWGRLDAASRPPAAWRSRCRRRAGCPTRWSASCASGWLWTLSGARDDRADRGSCGPSSSGSATRSGWSRPAPASSRPPQTAVQAGPAAAGRDREGRPRGDVGGLLATLEIDAATVRARPDRRRGAPGGKHGRGRAEPPSCAPICWPARTALRQLATECVATVDPAPRYAIPDVAALGTGAEHRWPRWTSTADVSAWWTGR